MSIIFANYHNDGEKQKIKASQIPDNEYEARYKGYLSCAEEGCDAKIVLAHRFSNSFFKTWPNSKHAADCMYYFENAPEYASQARGDTVLRSLSDKHKEAALKNANRKKREDEGKITKRAKNRKNVDKDRPPELRKVYIATDDPNAESELTDGNKTRMHSKKCSDLSDKDVGKALTVRGDVDKAVVEEDSVSFYFITNNDNIVEILFYNMFRENSSQAFGWIKTIGKYINEGNLISVSCIALCDKKGENKYQLQLRDRSMIEINGKKLIAFVNEINTNNT